MHFYQHGAADQPDALQILLVPFCISYDAVFSNFCVFWRVAYTYITPGAHRLLKVLGSLEQGSLSWEQLQPVTDQCESLAS